MIDDRISGDVDVDDLAECYRLVHTAVVSLKSGQMQIRNRFRNELDPFRDAGYPLNRVGILPRVLRADIRNWVNTPALAKLLGSNPGLPRSIGSYFSGMGFSRRRRIEFIEDVLSRIGTESYTAEWTNAIATKQVDDVIERSTSVTYHANEMLARTLEDKVAGHLSNRRCLNIMDIGTGSGNTITPLMEVINQLAQEKKVPSDFSNYIRVFLVDVSRTSVDRTADSLLSFMPWLRHNTPTGGLVKICNNFVNFPYDDSIKKYRGMIDIAVAGASLCHQTDFEPVFRTVRDLLSDDGVMHVWDWYNGPSFAAPYLRLSRDGRRRTVFYTWDKDNPSNAPKVTSICWDEVDEKERSVNEQRKREGRPFDIYRGDMDEREEERLFSRMENARKYVAVREMTSEEAAVVEKNFTTWLGLLGYYYRKGVYEDERIVSVSGMPIRQHLKSEYARLINPGNHLGFSYFNFLRNTIPVLDNSNPFEAETAYYMIEGTGRKYAAEMRKAGFSRVHDQRFIDVFRECRRRDEEGTMSGVEPAYQINYTFGKK